MALSSTRGQSTCATIGTAAAIASKCDVSVKNGTAIEYKFKQPEFITSLHLTFDSDLHRETLPGDCPDRLYLCAAMCAYTALNAVFRKVYAI